MANDGINEDGARVTIRTVAADAGVSVAAVSKVLRNAYGVSEALRTKVETSIERLGYRPSVAARGMRGQTFTLGVMLVGIDNPFLPSVYRGIESVTEKAGYKIMVGLGAARKETEVRLIEQMIDNRMDGIIIVATQLGGEVLESYAQKIPTVVIGHHEATAQQFDTINSDDVTGAELAVEALIKRGHKDIAMVALGLRRKNMADVSPQRERGYQRAMQRAGLAEYARIIQFPTADLPRGEAINALLTSPQRPSALFCWSDLDAIPILNAAVEAGLSVPDDLAIVGYDNSPVAALPLISLASIDQDGERMGRVGAEALFSRMAGRKVPEHILIRPTLIPRRSLYRPTV